MILVKIDATGFFTKSVVDDLVYIYGKRRVIAAAKQALGVCLDQQYGVGDTDANLRYFLEEQGGGMGCDCKA